MILNLDTRVQEIHLPVEYDPDFGTQRPQDVVGFVVTSYSATSHFDFILLMPNVDDDDELNALIQDVMSSFLPEQRKYTLRDIDDEDVVLFEKKYTPLLSFVPESLMDDRICFYWQFPPKHRMQ